MSGWEATEPQEWCGAWEGRAQITDGRLARTAVCGHLHRSSAEARLCAQVLAARLDSERMPSDYYVG